MVWSGNGVTRWMRTTAGRVCCHHKRRFLKVLRNAISAGLMPCHDEVHEGQHQAIIGRTTVANILAEAGVEPAPERDKERTWEQFIEAHWDSLCGCAFFTVEALGLFGTARRLHGRPALAVAPRVRRLIPRWRTAAVAARPEHREE